jgi:hypothetical protein
MVGDEAASLAAPQVPADASVDYTEARKAVMVQREVERPGSGDKVD